MTNNFEPSGLWKSILLNNSDKFTKDNLKEFRNIGNINNRLSSWDPQDGSIRYFKTLLMHFVWRLEQEYKKKNLDMESTIRLIKKQNLGNPVTIKHLNFDISLDYALCLEEILFLYDFMNISNVLEIGAGCGRTCHSILSIHKNIEQYTICDLPEMLKFSSSYLREVLNESQYKKIKFIRNDQIEDTCNIDLSININSFQEVAPNVIENYLSIISNVSRMFFCKNPTGKYDPKSINLKIKNKEEFKYALNLGLCNDVIEIFDKVELEKASEKYLLNYCPSGFYVEKDEMSYLWAQHHSVLYKKN